MDKAQKAKLTNQKVEQKAQTLAALLSTDASKGGKYDADWTEIDSSLVMWLITNVTSLDGAVMFGKSRRGDQYHVTVLAGEKRQNFWFGGNEEGRSLFDEWVRAFCEAIDAQR